jgi:hypothetical protein
VTTAILFFVLGVPTLAHMTNRFSDCDFMAKGGYQQQAETYFNPSTGGTNFEGEK